MKLYIRPEFAEAYLAHYGGELPSWIIVLDPSPLPEGPDKPKELERCPENRPLPNLNGPLK